MAYNYVIQTFPFFAARGVEAMITVSEIEEFLEEVRCFIHDGKTDFIFSKGKYALGKLGISIEDAFAMVSELTHENYYQGPTSDHDYNDQGVLNLELRIYFLNSPILKARSISN